MSADGGDGGLGGGVLGPGEQIGGGGVGLPHRRRPLHFPIVPPPFLPSSSSLYSELLLLCHHRFCFLLRLGGGGHGKCVYIEEGFPFYFLFLFFFWRLCILNFKKNVFIFLPSNLNLNLPTLVAD